MARWSLAMLLAAGCSSTHQIGALLGDAGGLTDAGAAADAGCRSDEDCACGNTCLSRGSGVFTCVPIDNEDCTGDPDCLDDFPSGLICGQLVRAGVACSEGACVALDAGGGCRTDDDCDCNSLCIQIGAGELVCHQYFEAGCSPSCTSCVQPERAGAPCPAACLISEDGGN